MQRQTQPGVNHARRNGIHELSRAPEVPTANFCGDFAKARATNSKKGMLGWLLFVALLAGLFLILQNSSQPRSTPLYQFPRYQPDEIVAILLAIVGILLFGAGWLIVRTIRLRSQQYQMVI